MVNNYLFSILLPTYNSSLFLDELLLSLSKQNIKNFIILTYDDLSKDDTITRFSNLCKLYKLKYKRIDNFNKKLGPKFAYEKLILASETPYIVFCDHDDYWLPEKLELHLKHFKKMHNRPALSIVNANVAKANLIEENYSIFEYLNLNKKYFSNRFSIALENKVPGICMAFNNELKNHLIPFNKNIIMHDWWVLLITKAINAEILISEKICLLYRQHDKNTIGLKNKKNGLNLKRILCLFKSAKYQLKMVYSSKVFNLFEFIFFLILRVCLAIKNL